MSHRVPLKFESPKSTPAYAHRMSRWQKWVLNPKTFLALLHGAPPYGLFWLSLFLAKSSRSSAVSCPDSLAFSLAGPGCAVRCWWKERRKTQTRSRARGQPGTPSRTLRPRALTPKKRTGSPPSETPSAKEKASPWSRSRRSRWRTVQTTGTPAAWMGRWSLFPGLASKRSRWRQHIQGAQARPTM